MAMDRVDRSRPLGHSRPQAPLPPGDGCEQLGMWYSATSRPVRDKQLSSPKRRIRDRARWPNRCDELL